MTQHLRLVDQALLGSAMVQRHRLDNGLTVITLQDRAAPLVTYQTWYRVGSRNERVGATGLAHLFEHLMFSQTQSLAPGEFDRLIEGTGGDSNAATWTDWTFYRLSLPSSQLELAVRLEAERMHQLTLAPDIVETERHVVMNERRERVEDDVDGWMDEQLMKQLFELHPYHWPTIGWMRDIESVDLPTITDFYRTWYVPNNATIVVVGDFSLSELDQRLGEHYGRIAERPVPALALPKEQGNRGRRVVTADKPVAHPRVLLGYLTCGQAEADWPALDIVATLLAGGPSSQLYRELVVRRELASTVDASISPFADPGVLRISASCMRDHTAEEVMDCIEENLARLARGDIESDALERAKNLTETAFWSHLADIDGKAEALGHYQTTMGDYRELMRMATRLASVELADVAAVAQRYLTVRNSAVVIANPSPDVDDNACESEPS